MIKKISNKKFEYISHDRKPCSSDTIFKNVAVKIVYYYDKDNKIVKICILLRKKYPVLAHRKSIFIVTKLSQKIKLIFSDSVIRIFKGNKNYIITILK